MTERFEDTAVGRFVLAARAFIAEVEREKIAERTMRGKEERARSGRIPQATGRGMYGYHYDPTTDRTRVVNGEQAAVVRRIFEDFAAGASIMGITNALNEEGAMQLSVEIEKTDDGASGVLEGVIPRSFESFEKDLSHHCMNIASLLQDDMIVHVPLVVNVARAGRAKGQHPLRVGSPP